MDGATLFPPFLPPNASQAMTPLNDEEDAWSIHTHRLPSTKFDQIFYNFSFLLFSKRN